MNINIYIEDSLGNYLNQYAKQIGKSRNALIREAVKEWVAHHGIRIVRPGIADDRVGVAWLF